MREKIRYAEEYLKVVVIAFTTDLAGDARKARWILQKEYPEMILIPCYAHQVCLNLVIHDACHSLTMAATVTVD